MYVNILPEDGNNLNFEFDVEYPRLTPDIRQIAKEIIFEQTGIQPEQQNAIFLSEPTGLQNIKKLSLPYDAEQLAPAPAYQNAQLDAKYPEIFDQSTVCMNRLGDWVKGDLRKPENRVKLKRFIEDTGIFLRAFHGELNRPRAVDSSLLDQFSDFRDSIDQDLTGFLTPTEPASPDPVVTSIELKCYVDIFRNIADDVAKFQSRESDSSGLHTLIFGSRMIQPTFFLDKHQSLEKLEMIAECSSGLRMFVKTNDRAEICRFAPKNNLAVVDKSSGLPGLICEVDFHDARKDHAMMVLQSVVACRQWRYVLPEPLKEKNRLLGLFIHDNFDVDLYLFHVDGNYHVEIFQQGFSLGQRNEALRLARILFNYRDKFLDVAGLSEPGKIQQIEKLVSDSNILPSFTETIITTERKAVWSGCSHQSAEQPTHATVSETRTDPLLLSEKVQSLLCTDGAELQATDHEYVAAVRKTGISSNPLGFIKLTNSRELRAFDTVRNSGSELLRSRVVLPTRVVEVSGYSVAFLPYGGEPLHKSWGLQDGPVGHETEIAWDLLTIISRLHDLHIAHLDIKPSNVLWSPTTHSIRVIDFDSSEILDPNGSRKMKGIFGTSGYAAPEVESDEGLEYDPFLADAFSCGQVLSDVVMAEKMTEEARLVLDISRELTRENVSERWSISKVMQVWADWLKERGRPEHER